jgi:pyruvate-ferredoxin/flavodoxin oxidoreductase
MSLFNTELYTTEKLPEDIKMSNNQVTIDANQAAAYVAHKLSEVIAIYPITPASPMGEWSDEWSMAGKEKYLGDSTGNMLNLQSEGGAAGSNARSTANRSTNDNFYSFPGIVT